MRGRTSLSAERSCMARSGVAEEVDGFRTFRRCFVGQRGGTLGCECGSAENVNCVSLMAVGKVTIGVVARFGTEANLNAELLCEDVPEDDGVADVGGTFDNGRQLPE